MLFYVLVSNLKHVVCIESYNLYNIRDAFPRSPSSPTRCAVLYTATTTSPTTCSVLVIVVAASIPVRETRVDLYCVDARTDGQCGLAWGSIRKRGSGEEGWGVTEWEL